MPFTPTRIAVSELGHGPFRASREATVDATRGSEAAVYAHRLRLTLLSEDLSSKLPGVTRRLHGLWRLFPLASFASVEGSS